MNANELVTKAIREGVKYVDDNTCYHRRHFESEDIDRMASTLSAGLIVLTEGKFREILTNAIENGITFSDSYHERSSDMSAEWILVRDNYSTLSISRIMREVKGGE